MMPTAMSRTFPRMMNSLNSLNICLSSPPFLWDHCGVKQQPIVYDLVEISLATARQRPNNQLPNGTSIGAQPRRFLPCSEILPGS
jgi:hypothetical protein